MTVHVTSQGGTPLTQINGWLVRGMYCVNVVEYLPGEGEEVVDVVDVPPPALELFLGLQLPRFQVNQGMVHARLEVKFLQIRDTSIMNSL